jgi:hypothetical protein
VIEIASRGTFDYFSNIIPEKVTSSIKAGSLSREVMATAMFRTGWLDGFGKNEKFETSAEMTDDDCMTVIVRGPFSLPLLSGMNAGGCEFIGGRDFTA